MAAKRPDTLKRAVDLQWVLSAPFYRFCYVRVAHQADEDLLTYLGRRLQGALVVDCGCGPGVVTAKLVQSGAAVVYAVDANHGMLVQVRRRLPGAVACGRVQLIQSYFGPELFRGLGRRLPRHHRPDLVLFKRSLYSRPEQALPILSAAGDLLAPGGALVMIHPERSLGSYAFAPGLRLATHTPYYLFNRLTSRLAEWLGIGLYTLYSRPALFDLFQSALPGLKVEWIPSRQTAFNLIAGRKPLPGELL